MANELIHFRYPEEEWQSVRSYNPPITFSLNEEGNAGKCETRYSVSRTFEYWRFGVFQSLQSSTSSYDGAIGIIKSAKNSDHTSPSIPGNSAIWINTGITTRYPNGFWNRIEGSTTSGVEYKNPIITNLVRTDGLPDNCGEPECRFEVTDALGVIYSRTETECPEVQGGSKCPPDTCCECEKGNRLCCYSCEGKLLREILI